MDVRANPFGNGYAVIAPVKDLFVSASWAGASSYEVSMKFKILECTLIAALQSVELMKARGLGLYLRV